MVTVPLLLLVVAFVCFVLSTFSVNVKHVNLVSLGLALWVLALLWPILRTL